MTAAVVFLLSAATLAFQVLLVRLFAIEQFHHFASMAIGVAMLGSGVTGTAMALEGRLDRTRAARWLAPAAAAAAVALMLGPALLEHVAVDPAALPWRAGEWARLGLAYTVLALPFASGALPVLLALAAEPERPGRIYGASFLGAGAGALGALAILAWLEPVHALAAPALIASGSAGLAAGARPRRSSLVAAGAAMVLALWALAAPPWRIDVTEYKALPQIEALPGASRVADRFGPLGWVVAARAPGFRHAPGLSLAYRGPIPPAIGLLVDGDLVGAVLPWRDPTTGTMLDWLPSALPYAMSDPGRVLVLGAGAGVEVPTALRAGAGSVTAVELHPELARLTDSLGGTAGDRRVRWAIADARSFVAGSGERYGLLVVGPSGGPGGAAAGTLALHEDYLHTVEAYQRYLDRLAPGGMMVITRWLETPPRGAVRAILTAAEALRRRDPAALERGLVVARSWATATVLVKPSGFAADELDVARAWMESRWFDLDWTPGLEAPAPGFNELEDAVLFRAARAAVDGPGAVAAFAAAYPFRVAPVTDARPFPHHFLRPGALAEVASRPRGEWLPVAEWGYLTLVATLIQSGVLGVLLLLVPTALRAGRPSGPGSGRLLVYFAALGVAYLAAEVAAIQQLVLQLGHPVYAVSAVLTVLLVASGVGSMVSDRVAVRRGPAIAGVVAALLGVAAVTGLPLAHALEGAPLGARAAAAAGGLAPLAVLMGMPFPLGLRLWARSGGPRVAWAWAANGFASVVAAPLGSLVALEAGIPALFLLAAAAYLAAAVTLPSDGGSAASRPVQA